MTLAGKLDVWQKDLLDMSRGNNLLYYKPEGRGAGIHFAVDVADLDPLYTRLLAGNQVKVANLPTGADEEELERRLARLRSRTREDLNDRGIHTLFLAFGLLEWREAEQSAETILSPLLLVPVTLERAGLLGQYSLKRLPGEDPEVNPTLREKLLHDFKAQIPSFEEIEERFERELAQRAQGAPRGRGPTPRLTLDRVVREIESALPPRIPGRAVRRELHLGRFFFQKLVMYRDLQRNRDNVLTHPLLRVIGGESGRLPDPTGLVAAHELDRRVPPHEVYEILDADSSQQEAIVAAKRGASFVLQGPPGTGKSQTIANMIAEALGQGKRVLFVSEKMAALEVVRKRLDAAGLGEFCLDLHNPRADKKAFMLGLKESLQAAQQLSPDNPVTWQREADALQRAREELNRFVRELHLPRLALGESAYFAYGKLTALHTVPDAAFALPDVPAIDHRQLDRMRRALADLDEHVEVLSRFDTYPWHETIAPAFSLQLASDIRAHFGRMARELERCESALATIGPLLEDDLPPATGAWAAETLRVGDLAITTPLPPRHWLDRAALPATKAHAAEAAARSAAYHTRRDQLLARYRAGFLACDAAALLRTLTAETAPALASLRAHHAEAPQDVARRRRDELGAHIARAVETLDAMLPAAGAVAELCGIAAPATLADVADLDEVASHLLTTPQPPESWLEPAAFPPARAGVAQAAQLYAYCAQVRGILSGLYAPAFFELPLPDLARRLREQYASPLRLLQPGYYRDTGALRSLLRRPGPYPVARMRTDLEQAVKLLEAEAGLRAQQPQHVALLGSAFRAERTDWAAVNAALDWTGTLHRRLAGRPPSEEIRRLASGSARHLRALRQRHERLHELWQIWQDEAAYLAETCEIERLLGDDVLLEDAAPDAARTAFARLRDVLAAFWAALDEIAAHRLPEPSRAPSSGAADAWEQVRGDLEQACELHAAETWMQAQSDQLAAAVGADFAGLETDWPRLLAMLDWTERFLALFPDRDLPEPLARLVAAPSPGADGADGDERRATLRATLPIAHEASRAIDEALRFADTVLPRAALAPAGVPFPAAPLAGIRERVRYLLDHVPELERWLACKQQLDACSALGLGGALDALLRERPFPRDGVARFEKRFYTLWLDCVWRDAPTLAAFRGESHERTIGRFRELDRGHINLARRRLIGGLAERRHAYARNTNSPALVELKRQVQLKRHRSIRQLVQRTGGALLEIKPCWMMSPLSISQFLEEGVPLFDLVIFDEASQVCAEDAICAILRGKQLIVVGDSKQLPPTRFFSKTLADDDDDDASDDEDVEEARVESILNECAVRMPERGLRWHYRSRHESLIAFSNARFYGDGLVTFPSTDAAHGDGVRWEYVADGVYQRSRTRTNPREAERVVDLIAEHCRTHGSPESLGVVALSGSQQRAIREALERRMQRAPELRAWEQELDEDNPAGFFVKNLESVQGDERDVIILSVGYGPDAPRPQGRVYANFGPVNKAGGERRLNVAVTRARTRLILVSSMTADDLPAEAANPGVRTLRGYLAYAQHGPAALREPEAGAHGAATPVFDSPFEEAVYEALAARGLALDTQVGCSGYRIDLAVRDAAGSDRYVLGIECDGARYHSSATARDRDRLRQKHLENMGWAIHRIWSTDWLRDPDGEIAKVLDRLTRATPPPHMSAPTRPPVRSAPRSATSPAASTYRPLPNGPLTDDASPDGPLAQAANDLLAPTVPLAGRPPAPPEAPALRDPERTIPPLPPRPAPATTVLPESRDPGPTLARPRPSAGAPHEPDAGPDAPDASPAQPAAALPAGPEASDPDRDDTLAPTQRLARRPASTSAREIVLRDAEKTLPRRTDD